MKAKTISGAARRRLLILIVTVLILAGICTGRAVYLCVSYPEVNIPISTLFGEDGENLSFLSADGNTLTATGNNTGIHLPLTEAIPVKEVEFDISALSRENCRSYITLTDTDTQSSTIMAKGKNYISFDSADPDDKITSLDLLPVTLRAVSFTYTAFIINPHGRFAFTSLRLFAFLLSAAVLTELVLFSIAEGNRKAPGKRPLVGGILLGALQCIHAVYFTYLYLTQDWAVYTMIYFFTIFVSISLFTFLVETGGRELPILRIALLSAADFAMTECLYSDQFYLDSASSIFGNLIIYALPFVICWLVTPSRHLRRFSYIVPQVFWHVVMGMNHYYFEFRGQAFELSDLSMLPTAVNVADQYTLDLSPEMFIVYVACAMVYISVAFEDGSVFRKKSLPMRGIAAAAAAFILLWLPNNLPYVNLWNTNIGTKHHGYALSYLSFAKRSLEKPVPEGYNRQETEALLSSYEGQGDTEEDSQDGAVNIIVIMDEAFSDLPDTYGFETDVDCMPFLHSLEGDSVRKGKMLVSVFGGTTADTEYEFLTGNSVSFLNGESVPYTQFITHKMESLAQLCKGRDYSAAAFHPYLPNGYKRYMVYPLLGFDTFISSDDDYPYRSRIRSYISDESDIRDLIDIYENRENYGIDGQKGDPLFLFNVTMQNHGGYNASVSAVDVTVRPTDESLKDLSQLQEYLSLVKETDAAMEELITYFQNVDEKTIILMFGDHQPGMNESVFRAMDPAMYAENASIEEKEKKYTVPYFMWANYPLTSEDLPLTSPNFLRSYLLENAGQAPSAYDRLLTDVRSQYPAINRFGFVSSDGKYHDISEVDTTDVLMDYKKAAYYSLFEHDKVNMDFFK